MFLKSIEIRGFKSFADKTELLFKKGVTAIVGPNGSGKSNVSDAVRWVLGEQSVKSLRGGKMEDVIFVGTQFRKPVGLCQVSLTLDNEDKKLSLDYADVTISRRLYRSGESEYYINNTQCRLRDIHELFMDTGIGKEGYSIIGQGKIEAVLSGRPEERRSLLEEAAGIVKFKWRKEEAEKKLENTEANLVRIDDILGTYKERLEPLKVENEKAKRFIKLSEELKEKEISIAIYSIDKVQSKIESIQEDINNKHTNSEELTSELSSLRTDIENWNEEIENINEKNSNYRKEYYYNKEKRQDIEADTKLLGERLQNFYSVIDKNERELKALQCKISELLSDEEGQNGKLKTLIEEQTGMNEQITEYENSIAAIEASILDENNRIKKLKNDQIEYLSTSSNLKNSVVILKNDVEALKEKISSIKNSCESYLHSIKINSSTRDMLTKQEDEIKGKVEEFENNIQNNRSKISRLNSIVISKEKEFRELNNLHSRLEANHSMLVNLDKQYEGYNRAVKVLMGDVSKGKVEIESNSCFVLGEIIEVEKKLETAIEIALGGAISDVITRDEEIAKKLIKYLKDNKIGRATFLPLNIIKGKKIATARELENIEGYIGIASELIQFDNRFTNAVQYILGRTIISSSMDSALKIAKASNYSFKIVTLSGEVVNPGGSLTGGSLYHKASNIIGRKREIEDTKLKIKSTVENINYLSNVIQKYREDIKLLDEESLNLRDIIYSQNIEITKIKGKINAIDNESGKLKEGLIVSNKEIELLNEKLKENLNELDVKEKELEEIKTKQKENNHLINELEEKLISKNYKILNDKEKFTEIKIQKAKVDENVLNMTNILKKLRIDIDDLKLKQGNIQEENRRSEDSIRKCKEQIETNNSEEKRIGSYILEMEQKIKDQDIEVIKIKEKVKIHSKKSEDLQLVINKKEDEIHKIQLLLERYNAEKEALYSKINDELEITYAEALNYKTEIENVEVYKKDIASLKSTIASLGVVNLGAVDEFKELTEKVNFMGGQREDLTNAKEELVGLINEMTDKMKTVFNENFMKLRKNFDETFKELFKGGSADLILVDGDELTGHIDITVQPPGKKLQNINLMSGGEKGLSAIALLFAILKMKPTPFCILDEIEAALDDANVVRYAEFLKKFSENIQFIVITHRKGTMEASDALYGVTMEEKGVSKIVSVDLASEAS